MQWTGKNYDEVEEFMHHSPIQVFGSRGPGIIIPTLEGDHRADVGDWIVCGVEGEFYPIKPSILAKTYEEVGHLGSELERLRAIISPGDAAAFEEHMAAKEAHWVAQIERLKSQISGRTLLPELTEKERENCRLRYEAEQLRGQLFEARGRNYTAEVERLRAVAEALAECIENEECYVSRGPTPQEKAALAALRGGGE